MQVHRGNALRWTTLGGFVVAAAAAGVVAACSSPPATDSTARSDQAASQLRKVPQSANPYTLFETLQVRPLALSSDGKLLFAANTPDNRLEIFAVGGGGLTPVGSVEVGLEPVAVGVLNPGQVWVVNHLSDSVSIVNVGNGSNPHVTRTLLVGDEPRDIVFAGPNHNLAFVTTAHRGQSSPDDPDLFAPVGRADVWVFDADNLGAAPGGTRLTKITLFADTPRALAATPDGKRVYAAAFLSGNQTTTVSEDAVAQVYKGVMPGPSTISFLGQTIPQPPTGLIVKSRIGPDGQPHWVDAYGTAFDPFVRVSLPDYDVFAIDATASPPAAVGAAGTYAHVGTTLMNMAVNPRTGKVYVTNTDAHNDVRFEGHTPGFTSVAGNIVDSRISVVDPTSGSVVADNLNPQINHAADTGDPSLAVAFPQDIAVSSDGSRIYVVGQGSSKLAIYNATQIESGSLAAGSAKLVALTGGGPTGVALDESAGLAFVLTRFDDSISVVDLASGTEKAHLAMFSPEPASVTAGRQYLYDAAHTSKHGDQACASCHIGADFDGLAWDLGNPGGNPLPITRAFNQESDVSTIPEAAVVALLGSQAAGIFAAYQPAKGPMTTQSLRGMDNHGAMHWRGDRNGAVQQNGMPFLGANGAPVVSAQPSSGIFDEVNAFESFNVAFPGLVGNAAQLSADDMSAFTAFTLQITYPPNPIRNLDNSLTLTQAAGAAFFANLLANGAEAPVDRFHNCKGCHALDRNGNAGQTAHPGFFGTDGRLSFENESQIFKVPHLRNAYQKIGMYASSLDSVHAIGSLIPQLNPPTAGVRGFGFQHDGATATLDLFFTAFVFVQTTATVTFQGTTVPPNPFGIPLFANPADPLNPANGISLSGAALRRALSSYVFAFDSNMFPVVGQQVTATEANLLTVLPRLALFKAQATAGACDLVARGFVNGRDSGFVLSAGLWVPDVSTSPELTDAQVLALLAKGSLALTFTCVPPGSGWRIGIDRDGDGVANGDEIALGTNPANPRSVP
jgi:DNA-binding beta-propeller fold protein YncE